MKHTKETVKMKKKILLLLLSFLCCAATHAQYQESSHKKYFFTDHTNFYAKFLSGVNLLQNSTTDGNKSSFKAGYVISGSLGYCCPCSLRLEAEFAFRRNAIKKIDFFIEGCSFCGHFQNYSGMANLLWDLPLSSWGCASWNVQPFIGGGLGYDSQQMHAANSRIIFHQKWTGLSWQAMAGLTYPIFCNTAMMMEYKFHQGRPHFYNHYIGIGLVYKFGS
jgi:opacity protein-like surface antigen